MRDLDLLEGSPSLGDEDIDTTAAATATATAIGRTRNDGSKRVPETKIAHIPTLGGAEETLRMLRRIHQEFFPIIQRRGYHVVSVSEMCCCGDGVDHLPHRRRKTRVMPNNVLGYNRSMFGRTKFHTIHLRLRDPRNHHRLLSYEEVAGTMAHELAHCEHGPHNAKFYKLMDEIQEQHAVYLTRGIVADRQGFPLNSNEAYTLGAHGGNRNHPPAGGDQRNNALRAAQTRREKQRWMPQGPQKLGGDKDFRCWLRPREAAGMAAESRRIQDELWCQPCQPEIVEISSDEEEFYNNPVRNRNKGVRKEHDDDSSTANKSLQSTTIRPARKKRATKTNTTMTTVRSKDIIPAGVIDLISDDDDDDDDDENDDDRKPAPLEAQRQSEKGGTNDKNDNSSSKSENGHVKNDKWDCASCTFRNNPEAAVCAVCGTESARTVAETTAAVRALVEKDHKQFEDENLQLTKKLVRDEAIKECKSNEVARSREQFGFNIYGTGETKSSKMNHIT